MTAEQLGAMGSWEFITATGEVIWSDNLYRLFGLEPNEIEPTQEYVTERTHPDDRQRVAEEVARIQAGESRTDRLEYRIVLEGGGVRHLLSTITAVETDPRRVMGYVQDISERRLADREIESHIAVAKALALWESLDRSGERLLQALGGAMEFAAAVIWLPEDGFLVPRVFWQAGSADASELEGAMRDRRIAPGAELPGQVWESRQPAGVFDIADDAGFPQSELAAMSGMRGAVALPALTGDEVLAVLEFYSREEFAPTDRLMQSLTGIGRELGHFLDRRRGELLPPTLTPRELEILQLAARGRSAPDIAEELVVSRETVKSHLSHIYSKLEVNDRAAAVAQGLRLGLIE